MNEKISKEVADVARDAFCGLLSDHEMEMLIACCMQTMTKKLRAAEPETWATGKGRSYKDAADECWKRLGIE